MAEGKHRARREGQHRGGRRATWGERRALDSTAGAHRRGARANRRAETRARRTRAALTAVAVVSVVGVAGATVPAGRMMSAGARTGSFVRVVPDAPTGAAGGTWMATGPIPREGASARRTPAPSPTPKSSPSMPGQDQIGKPTPPKKRCKKARKW